MKDLIFTKIPNNPSLEGLATYVPDVVYSTARGLDIKLHLIVPQGTSIPDSPVRYPCIVFVQGSAWTFPDVNYEIPQLSAFAQKGYVVATVTHRDATKGHPAPAFLEDVKTAIRFLRANAEQYRIDPKRVGIWGTSSGGNTALLVGLTGDDPAYRTDEYPEQSDAVRTVVECFGPADVPGLFNGLKELAEAQGIADQLENNPLMTGLFGADPAEQQRRMSAMNPAEKVVPGKDYPPFLLIHGTVDPVVPYSQSEDMARRLCAADVHTEMICVEGAEHEGTFWSQQLLDMIADYLQRTL